MYKNPWCKGCYCPRIVSPSNLPCLTTTRDRPGTTAGEFKIFYPKSWLSSPSAYANSPKRPGPFWRQSTASPKVGAPTMGLAVASRKLGGRLP